MNVSLNELSPEITYKLLAGLVIPRPIAWISTRGENGIANCAPFSFFNLVSAHPPMCAIGINARTTGESKDTIVNILRAGEFGFCRSKHKRQSSACMISVKVWSIALYAKFSNGSTTRWK